MSSANPKVSEPSMEEILASIRRIISDEGDMIASSRPHPGLYAVPHQDEPDSQDTPESEALRPLVEAAPPASENDEPVSPAVDEPATAISVSAAAPDDGAPASPLLSNTVSASVANAFGRLEPRPQAAAASTLEDTVKEMLRPMLKAWLDQNLPGIVERLVQAEIERVTRA
ncbi:DUF2497 domain-containing protein [Microvirga pudoricolor]|uniref:DUF2497 domain-containing protein n=1 Tax=Microvirga pudoricolor TaxID=2778729 RepID=UPI002D2199D0|nr:DUF2497 domain-containing protein [Microvirga pudoricolor]